MLHVRERLSSAYRRSVSAVARRARKRRERPSSTRIKKIFGTRREKYFSRTIDVSGFIQVSQRTVWRCCSWLPPQRRRTRRQSACHCKPPPTSRRPCQGGSATRPVGSMNLGSASSEEEVNENGS